MQSSPLDPVASERLSHADRMFTSDLSINEFALLHGAGFAPIELVMGAFGLSRWLPVHRPQAAVGTAGAHRGDLSCAVECHGAHAG